MQRSRHSTAFIEQALAKARDRGNRTLEAVAQEINISLGTLTGWLGVLRWLDTVALPTGFGFAEELPSRPCKFQLRVKATCIAEYGRPGAWSTNRARASSSETSDTLTLVCPRIANHRSDGDRRAPPASCPSAAQPPLPDQF